MLSQILKIAHEVLAGQHPNVTVQRQEGLTTFIVNRSNSDVALIDGLKTVADNDKIYSIVMVWPSTYQSFENIDLDQFPIKTGQIWSDTPEIALYKHPVSGLVRYETRSYLPIPSDWDLIINDLIEPFALKMTTDGFLQKYTPIFSVFLNQTEPYIVLKDIVDKYTCLPISSDRLREMIKPYPVQIAPIVTNVSLNDQLDVDWTLLSNHTGLIVQLENDQSIMCKVLLLHPSLRDRVSTTLQCDYNVVKQLQQQHQFTSLEQFKTFLKQENTPDDLINTMVMFWLLNQIWYAFILKQANIILMHYADERTTSQPTSDQRAKHYFEMLDCVPDSDKFNQLVERLKQDYEDLPYQPDAIDELTKVLFNTSLNAY